MKLILGFVGQIASGKGTAAAYLKEKHHASVHRFSTMLRDVLNRLYLEVDRDNLQKLSSAIREFFGSDTLSKVIAEDVKKDTSELIVIDGVRRPDDVKYLKNIPAFILVNINADIEKKYERIIKRGENTDDTIKTFEEFKKDHGREAEVQINDIAREAAEHIDNNGTLKELYKQLDEIISKYTNL